MDYRKKSLVQRELQVVIGGVEADQIKTGLQGRGSRDQWFAVSLGSFREL